MTEILYCPFNLLQTCPDCPGSTKVNHVLTDLFGKDWPGKVYLGRGMSPEATEIQDRALDEVDVDGVICIRK